MFLLGCVVRWLAVVLETGRKTLRVQTNSLSISTSKKQISIPNKLTVKEVQTQINPTI